MASDVSGPGGPEAAASPAFRGTDQTLIVGDIVLKIMRPSSEIDAPYCIPAEDVTVSSAPTEGFAPPDSRTRNSVIPPIVEPSE